MPSFIYPGLILAHGSTKKLSHGKTKPLTPFDLLERPKSWQFQKNAIRCVLFQGWTLQNGATIFVPLGLPFSTKGFPEIDGPTFRPIAGFLSESLFATTKNTSLGT